MAPHRARRRRPRRSGRRILRYAVVASALLVAGTTGGTVYVKARAHDRASLVSSSSSAPRASPTASEPTSGETSVAPGTEPSADRTALLTERMRAVTVAPGAEVSVAVLDLDSGERAAYGTGSFDTASIVKVDILAALLLQAQDADRRLTAREKTFATAMITNSDNASASALWDVIGRADGLDAANDRFGLTATEGGDGALWGLTRTTAADQLTLLQQVFGDGSLLGAASRTYLQGLMGEIADGQRWGVSAAADGSAFALKNGWLPRSTTGLWDVNSIGRITVGGHDCLVAALSDGNATMAKGISLVEAAARAAVSAYSAG
ncbi:serine hydrolase [Streptomyces sp. NPDC007074]|uniref:serine hydrolase n=1 Tax=Streptomyces sp. NPDC007074 TaxID=3156764 RepID=UPI0033D53D58